MIVEATSNNLSPEEKIEFLSQFIQNQSELLISESSEAYDIAISGDNNIILALDKYKSSNYYQTVWDVFLRVVNIETLAISSETVVNTNGYKWQNDNAILVGADKFVIGWKSSDMNQGGQIRFQIYNNNGEKFGSEINISVNNAKEFRLIDNGETFFVVSNGTTQNASGVIIDEFSYATGNKLNNFLVDFEQGNYPFISDVVGYESKLYITAGGKSFSFDFLTDLIVYEDVPAIDQSIPEFLRDQEYYDVLIFENGDSLKITKKIDLLNGDKFYGQRFTSLAEIITEEIVLLDFQPGTKKVEFTLDNEDNIIVSWQDVDGIKVSIFNPYLVSEDNVDQLLLIDNNPKIFLGTNIDDVFYGTDGDDEIHGGDGDDIIYASAGNDIYDGGDGIDTVITDYINSPPSVGGSISLRNIENQFFIGETNITIDRSLDPESGNNHVRSQSGDDRVLLGVGDDTFELGSGKNYSVGGEGNDTIILHGTGTFGSGYVAFNISSALQTGTEERLNLNGKTRFEDVMDGGADVDTVDLTDASDAFFLHDSFSGFHSSLTLSNDYEGRSGTARIENIENIKSGDGDDIIDLTSPDYSLAGQSITVDGGEGNDTLWGSDANETLKGGNGDDELFGGAGVNELIGGAGADEFQFTKTSSNDTVVDFNISDGDTLKFFNTGGALFDRNSIFLNSAGDEMSIAYGSGVDDALTVSLLNAGLQLDDLTADVLIIV